MFGMIALFFHEVLLGRRVFHYGDLSSYFFPYLEFFFTQLRHGVFAQWCPFDGTGVSLLANPQTGAFYPFNFVYLLLSAPHAMSVSIVLHFLIAALGVLLLLRGFRLGWLASLAGALSFAFSGTLISLSNTLDYFEAAVWVPFVLHFVLAGLWDRPSWRRLAGGAIAYALMVMCSPEYALITAAFVAVVVCATIISQWRRAPRRTLGAAIGAVFLLGVIGVMLAAIQLAPTLAALPYSAHSHPLSLKEVTRVGFQPVALLNQLIPHLYYRFDGVTAVARQGLFAGSRPSWLLDTYSGVFVLLCGLVGLLSAPRRHRYLWGGMALISVLLAMSNRLPFYRWLYELAPAFRHFRYAEKFLLFFALAAAVLAGFGLHRILTDPGRVRRTIWVTGLVAVPLLAISLWRAIDLRSFAVHALKDVFGQDPAHYGGQALATLADHLTELMAGLGNTTLLVIALLGCFWLALKKTPRPQLAGVLVLLVAMTDLFVANRVLAPQITPAFYSHRPAVFGWMNPGAESGRYQSLDDWQTHRPPLPAPDDRGIASVWQHRDEAVPNYGLTYGMASAHPISVLMSAEQDEFYDRFRALPFNERLDALRLLNVRWLLTTRVLQQPGIDRRGRLRALGYEIDEDRLAFPRAFLVPRMVLADNASAAMELLLRKKIDPAVAVVWERLNANELASESGGSLDGTSATVTYQADRATVLTRSTRPAYLVLSDAYAPGWSCTVDGHSTTIRRAFGLLRSAPVGAGEHRVEFRYRQPGLLAGIALSAGGWLALGILWFVGRRRTISSRQERTPE